MTNNEKSDWEYIAEICNEVIKRNHISKDQINEVLRKIKVKPSEI